MVWFRKEKKKLSEQPWAPQQQPQAPSPTCSAACAANGNPR